MTVVETPAPGREAALEFVERNLLHVVSGDVAGSGAFVGGQAAADAALAGFDVVGYARKRSEVHPSGRRGASRLSPYIRHGLLTLRTVWDHVAGGPSRDVAKFRDELLWQEFARHWYARLGVHTRRGVRHRLDPVADDDGWNREMACLDVAVGELEADGWLVNQTRMWLASHWTVRNGLPWRDGEDYFFRHLLDGSRAANRLGWQWTTGVGSNKSYGFSRSQVVRRAPGLCDGCTLRTRCPIEHWPADPALVSVERPELVGADPHHDRTAGPIDVVRRESPDEVWLTAESLGDADPALAANAERPVVFVFDEPLLATLRLSAKRLVFLVETLSELGQRRDLEIAIGRPDVVLAGRSVAVTDAPVSGHRRIASVVSPSETHPWPWLVRPHGRSVASFSQWRRHIEHGSP